ncbi:glycoside hydrolase family 127 protein [Cohnella sp. JJ-181]|uniref:glycoside hydrolase family 127 protein n=1 Tax=Cohnella rhizoplanae TaxID=2974897 RepID=UPI0022FF78B4|nr:beta-L-arabinofuranosidase domain-containing protein [Cohnella sp. JJ-181]CAI6087597.1 Non-reducing end beta-L-arabinofuranosidase [Cohnella sp. JJ-181]
MTLRMKDAHPRPLDLKKVSIEDPYWSPYLNLIRNTVIPYQWEALNDRVPDADPSRAIRNFRIAAGLETGKFEGFVFQDSDLYKWLEAVGYALAVSPDPDLERIADEAIELIAAAQQADGYLNTYFTVAEPERRWTNLTDCHELYCAGHLIEAAVAYFYGTGKRNLLDVACRLADHVDALFGPGPGQIRGYDGHQEIELALVKLAEATGADKYMRLASFFIDERGQQPSFFRQEWESRGRTSYWQPGVVQKEPPSLAYHQADKPVREQSVATGHAVRAVYMYAAMADLAARNNDEGLLAACRRLWNNVVHKQMYVNGSIGSTHHGEAFTFDYDLPNDTNYSETCASIGLILFAQRMLRLEARGEYGDVLERALYNTVTAGMASDGKHFFYVNPMEVWPEASAGNPGKHHVKAVRQKWYGCACCPPNVARLLSSLGSYAYSASEDALYAHLHIGGEAKLDIAGRQVTLRTSSELPWSGRVALTLAEASGAGAFTLAVRVPSWSPQSAFSLNGTPLSPDIRDGYAYVERDWQEGDVFEIALDMQPRRIYAAADARANAGRVALQRGPLVYCIEETDNGAPIASLAIRAGSELRPLQGDGRLAGTVLLEADGLRQTDPADAGGALYRTSPPESAPQRIVAVPYTLWGNREPGEMQVWIRELP